MIITFPSVLTVLTRPYQGKKERSFLFNFKQDRRENYPVICRAGQRILICCMTLSAPNLSLQAVAVLILTKPDCFVIKQTGWK